MPRFLNPITITTPGGSAPLVVNSSTVVTNLNADLLDGQHGSFYQNAGNLNAGTIPTGRLSGTYPISISGSADVVSVADTRTVTTTPQTIDRSVRFDFKENASNGLNDGGNYFGLMTFRQWGTNNDWSGGLSHQLGFTDNGNIWQRSGSSTTWGAWKKLWDDANDGAGSGLDADLLDGQHGSYYAAASSLGNYLPLTGGTLTGGLTGTTASFTGDLQSGGAIIRASASTAGQAWLSTAAYGVSQGDGRTHFGYNTGTQYENYIRGAHTVVNGSFQVVGAVTAQSTLAVTGAITQNGNQVLHAGNYSSYALPLAGGTLTGELSISTGGATGIRVNSPAGNQSFWIRVGYDTDGTATPVASALNTMLQSSGSSAGTFTIVCGNTKTATLSNTAANFAVALQQGGNQVLHAGNVSAYALPIGGGTVTGNLTINGTLSEGGYQAFPERVYTVDLTAQSAANFYPIVINGAPGSDNWHHRFSLEMPSLGGASAYNMHHFHGEARGGGWSDQTAFYRVFHNCYQDEERSVLGLWRGTQNWFGIVIYVRGGQTYYVRTNSRSVTGYTSAVTLNSATFAIKNAAGADVSGTSANIGEMFNAINTPQGFHSSYNNYIGGTQVVTNTGTWGISISGTAATATTANSLNASNNYQVNSIGVGMAGSGVAGQISLNQLGIRSWTITPSGGNLNFASGDGNGAANFSVALQQGGQQVLHAGNYTSYALPLTGGTVSGFTAFSWDVLLGRLVAFGNRNYQYNLSHGGAQDLAWKKIADITIANVLYSAITLKVDVIDPDTNFGHTASCFPMTFFASCRRAGSTLNNIDDAFVTGPVADYVRVVKTALGVYELQIRQIQDWKHHTFTVEAISTGSGVTLTYVTGTPPNGSTTGTIYLPGANWTQRLPNLSVTATATVTGATSLNGGLSVNGQTVLTATTDPVLRITGGSADNSTHLYTDIAGVGKVRVQRDGLIAALGLSVRSGTNVNTGANEVFSVSNTGAVSAASGVFSGALSSGGNSVLTVGNYSSYAVDNTKRVKQFFWDSLSASTTQARRYEIARIAIDIVNWNQVGTFEIELCEQYYSKGIKKRYAVWYGYSGTRPGLKLVEMTGAGDNNFQVVLGTEQPVSGNHYYLPVYVDVRYYTYVDVRVTTSRQIAGSNPPPAGYTYINSSPTPTNISDFTADSTVDLSPGASAWLVGGNVLLHGGNFNSYAPTLTGTGASGTWGISISGSAVSSTTQSKSDSSTSIATTAFSKWLFATFGTGGTTDWNHVSNTMPGTGTTLLLGNATNGFGPNQYYHPVNFEYAGTGGTGNVTQLAVAYGLEGNDLRMRGRYSGTWTSWVQFLNSSNYSNYLPPTFIPRLFAIASIGGTPSYIYLGRWSGVSQSGDKLSIKIIAGNGFNATPSQNSITELFFKSSNGSSFQTGSTGNFYADGVAWVYGQTDTPQTFRVVEVNTATYDIYGYFATFTGNSFYQATAATGTWTHSGAAVSTPTGNFIDILPRRVLDSTNYTTWAPSTTGTGATGTWGISITGNAATATNASQLNGQAASFYQNAGNLNAGTLPSARLSGTYTIDIAGAASSGSRLGLWDGTTYITGSNTISGTGGRGVNLAPNTYVKQISFEFKNTSFASMGGNYGGLITIAPWDGTAVGTGDPNYQLLFSASAANSTSNPVLRLRAGIDAGWGAWATLIHDANFATAIPNSGVGAGTYNNVTVNAKGIVTGGSNVSYLTANQNIGITGDATGSGTTSIVLTLANSGVSAGTYRSVTVNAKGIVTAGTNPSTLSGYGITDALSTSGGTVNGNLTIGSGFQHLASDGTAAAPGYSFSADTNTGICRTAADTMGLVAGGIVRASIDSNGINAVNGSALLVYRDGSASISPMLYWANAANNRAYNWQLDTGNNATLWSYNGTAWASIISITSAGSLTASSFFGAGTGLTGTASSLTAGAVAWSGVTGKPTTLSGYGITDAINTSATAQTKSGDLTVGGNFVSNGTATVKSNGTRTGTALIKFAQNIGDNYATSFNVDHNLSTTDVLVQVIRLADGAIGNYTTSIVTATANRVTVTFAAAPTTSQYRVVVVG